MGFIEGEAIDIEERFLDCAGRRVRPGDVRGTQTSRRSERGRGESARFARNDGQGFPQGT